MNTGIHGALGSLLAASLLASGIAIAQPGGAAAPRPVTATLLAGKVYFLPGGNGANSSALVGFDGVLLVDAKSDEASAEGIVSALADIGAGDVRYLVNTHEHPDHTGGNEFFGERGATIVSLAGVRDVLAAGQRGGPPAPDVALPGVTIAAGHALSLHFDGETVEIVDMPAAHTASNAMVHFVNADVYHLGDLYTRTRYPVIAGGTLQGFIDATDRVLAMADDDAQFIPGIGEVGDRDDLLRYLDMLVTVRDRVAALVADGKSLDEVLAAKPTAEFDATYGDPSRLFLPPIVEQLSGD
jgi:glyoxylase-like metal-dependent hydrolase (beta-lactamase superfamily II)